MGEVARIKGRWAPGVSGNPGGRPAVVKPFREACRNFMETRGWQKLQEMAEGEGATALRALELIAGYAYGRPREAVEVSQDSGLRIVISENVAAALQAGSGRPLPCEGERAFPES